ncbi:hypothetical protein AMTR_s00022p00059580 [Amborella trichopoda]|uniref:Uncharacterized protein n=1 Tax=Amborella trichopoda TaxID=13333 RepID=W1PUC8_AMBTC|nr:hypothetical protein AMTR_s00022p00059580 [Amborella trichopoda]
MGGWVGWRGMERSDNKIAGWAGQGRRVARHGEDEIAGHGRRVATHRGRKSGKVKGGRGEEVLETGTSELLGEGERAFGED